VQLRAALAGLALLAAPAAARAQPADDAVDATVRVYADDDRVQVVTPSVWGRAGAGPVDLDVGAAVDVVSAASVDIVTSASPKEMTETRWQLDALAGWHASRTQLVRGGITGSHEDDYDSLRGRAGWRGELARRNLTLDVDYRAGIDRVGRAGDGEFHRRRTDHLLTVGITQLLDRRTYADVDLELRRSHGFQASPYRTVAVIDPATTALMEVDEVTPRLRQGAAATARIRRALGARPWYAHGWYRFYADDWGVRSHTAGVQLLAELRGTLAGVALRGYRQGAADFHRSVYTLEDGAPPALRTADRALGRMASVHASLTCDLPLDGGARLIASLGLLHLRFDDSPAQAARTAVLVAVGLRRPL
jgi:hypothetical protein